MFQTKLERSNHLFEGIMHSHGLNAQVASEGKVPKKPGGCNRSHIPKALEHLTGLPNPQPSHKPPVPGPLQVPVTLKPDGSVDRKKEKKIKIKQQQKKLLKREGGDREGMPRTAKLLQQFNPQCHANRAMNTLQAHGTTTHILTKNTAGQCLPQGSHDHMTAANATEHTKRINKC